MVNPKTIWAIVLIILLAFSLGSVYYLSKDRISGENKDNFVTGNIIYESVEPDVIDPIKVKSIVFNN